MTESFIANQALNTVGKSEKRLCVYRKNAIVTLETALVLPLFIMGMLAIIFLINVTYINRVIGMELDNVCREMAAYCGITNMQAWDHTGNASMGNSISAGNGSDSLGISSEMLSEVYAGSKINLSVKENKIVGSLLSGAVNLSGSSILKENGIIDLVAEYEVKIPGLPFQSLKLKLAQRSRMHGWTGYDDSGSSEDNKDIYVYIAETGTVYHKDPDCTYLKPHVRMVSESVVKNLRSDDGSKYYHCEICGTIEQGGACYITEYGNRYHSDRNCSGIKRTVQRISIKEVGNRRSCSKCGESH